MADARGAEHPVQRRDLLVRGDHRGRTGLGEGLRTRRGEQPGQRPGPDRADRQRPGVLPQRTGGRQTRRQGWQERAGVVEDLPRYPVAGVKDLAAGLRLAEVGEQLRPARGRRRGRRLREVAEHGDRPGRATAADRPALHGRQVLRLVHDDVGQAGSPLDEVAGLVDEHRVGGGPARGARPAGRWVPADRRLLGRIKDAVRGAGEQGRIGEQPHDEADRIGGWPGRVDRRADLPGPPHRLVGPVIGGLSGRLHPGEDHMRDAVAEHGAAGAIANAALTQLGHQLRDLVPGYPPPPRPAGEDQGLGGLA